MIEKGKRFIAENKQELYWGGLMASFAGQVYSSFINGPSGSETYLGVEIPERLGSILIYSAGILTLYSQFRLGRYITKKEKKDEIFMEGAHGLCRHPIYLGFRILSLGTFIENPSLENLTLFGAVQIMSELTARAEEEKLSLKCPEAYKDYASRVPRWIPYSNRLDPYKEKILGYGRRLIHKKAFLKD